MEFVICMMQINSCYSMYIPLWKPFIILMMVQMVIETVFSESWQKFVMDAAAAFSDEYRRKNHIVLHSTGPWMLMALYDQLSEKEKSDVYLIPDKYVTPFDVNQASSVAQGGNTEELNNCLAEAYSVHYFFGLWKNAEK